MINPTSSLNSVLTTASTITGNTSQAAQKVSFSEILNGILAPEALGGQVNEEDLYSALIEERLTSLQGGTLAATYKERLAAHRSDSLTATGHLSMEDSANIALKSLITDGLLSQADAESIRAQAFKGAQLDGNDTALYDSIGSPYDNTIAVALVEMAIQSAEGKITSFDSGNLDAGRLAFDIQTDTSQPSGAGTVVTGENAKGLIWKPISESNGKVAVVLQPYLKGKADTVSLVDSTGNIIEKTRLTSVDDIGRSIFRLRQTGTGYPDNLTVQVSLKNGETLSYRISEPANRTVF